MVTKGYRKGVYKWVTLGIRGGTGGYWLSSAKALFGGAGAACKLPVRFGARGCAIRFQKLILDGGKIAL